MRTSTGKRKEMLQEAQRYSVVYRKFNRGIPTVRMVTEDTTDGKIHGRIENIKSRIENIKSIMHKSLQSNSFCCDLSFEKRTQNDLTSQARQEQVAWAYGPHIFELIYVSFFSQNTDSEIVSYHMWYLRASANL